MGFSGCSPQAQKLWCRGLFAQRHVESSGTRNQTPHVRVGLERKLGTEELRLLNCGVGEDS